ncbi:phage integrase SAM-like domain-containing protein [Psychroflexus planctonicus]|uniref:Transposase n=1 Tax=Psychroflexus planctonicus TaxID=1526575 RepID=A0ABQ1SIU1_9FLAO|nr:phage integrase SAM-like domain-containing protein [Psychroflexus planctonicus]GGE42177.1 transposase [Psychroflexus planctonicus]
MASVNFIYRSHKENAPLKVRLQDKDVNNDSYQFEANTKIHTSKEFWNGKLKKDKNGKLKDGRNLENYSVLPVRLLSYQKLSGTNLGSQLNEINEKTKNLENFILEKYEQDKPTKENKEWLKSIIKEYYTPKVEKRIYPTILVDFIDFYLQDMKAINELKESKRKRVNTTKNKIIRLQAELNKTYRITDIDDYFKADFVSFSTKYKYSQNTQSGDFQRIKTICKHASKKGLQVNDVIFETDFKITKAKSPKIYLTYEDIDAIKKAELKHDYLENARDWLLISIYTGQRISDFMRFKSDMINTDESGRKFLKFIQQKTGHEMYLPIRSELIDILNKRNGEFPRQISDQKYNDFIKEVCKVAKLNSICEGKKRICLETDKSKATKYDYRDVLGKFEKWELVSSHIGRRTFATLNYSKISTPNLMYFTGHTTEKEFLNYIVLPDKDKANRAYDSFANMDANKTKQRTLEVVRNDAVNQ